MIVLGRGERAARLRSRSVLLRHADVADAAVVGRPDGEWQEAVTAVVVLREGPTGDAEDPARALCRGAGRVQGAEAIRIRRRAAADDVGQVDAKGAEGLMDHAGVQRWLDDYVAAWKSYDPEAIAALFAEDVDTATTPTTSPSRARGARGGMARRGRPGCRVEPDEPETYDAAYAPVAVEGDVAVAVGTSRYTNPETVYDNCYLIRFDGEGRCREFTEFFMRDRGPSNQLLPEGPSPFRALRALSITCRAHD